MIIPAALGVLLVLVGLALLTLAAAEWLQGADMAGSLAMTVALSIAPASLAQPALPLRLNGRRAGAATLQIVRSILLPVLPDVERQLDAVAQILFVEDAADVPLHRPQTEVEFGGDLFV